MKIYCVVNSNWKEGDKFSKEQYFTTVAGTESYFRDEIKQGYVEELTVASPITNDILVRILNGENFIEKRSQMGYKYTRK